MTNPLNRVLLAFFNRYPNIVDPETIGARRAGQYEGWITNSKATWYNGELSEYPGVDFTSSGMDWYVLLAGETPHDHTSV